MDDTNVLSEDLQRRYHDLIQKTHAVIDTNHRGRTWRSQVSRTSLYLGTLTAAPVATLAATPVVFTVPEVAAAICGAGFLYGAAVGRGWRSHSVSHSRKREKKTEAAWRDARDDFLDWGHDAAKAVWEAGAGTLTIRSELSWDEEASSPLMRLDTPLGTTRMVSPYVTGSAVWLLDTDGALVRRSYASMLEQTMPDSEGYDALLLDDETEEN